MTASAATKLGHVRFPRAERGAKLVTRAFARTILAPSGAHFAIFPLPTTLTRAEMPNQRIVITGIGALSPNGVGRESYFDALKAGPSGIRTITQFDASALPCRVAGEVDFDPTLWVDAKNMKHVSRVVPMAIAATDEALRDAKLDPAAVDLETRRNIGVMLGSGGGAIEFSERMYELWFDGHEKQASIYSIPSGTIGTIACEISMAYDLHGFSHLISTGCTSSPTRSATPIATSSSASATTSSPAAPTPRSPRA